MSVAMTPRGVGVPRELSIKVVVNGPMLFELSPWLGRSSLASLSDLCVLSTLNNTGILKNVNNLLNLYIDCLVIKDIVEQNKLNLQF